MDADKTKESVEYILLHANVPGKSKQDKRQAISATSIDANYNKEFAAKNQPVEERKRAASRRSCRVYCLQPPFLKFTGN